MAAKRISKAEREKARKRSEAAQKGAITREKNRKAAEKEAKRRAKAGREAAKKRSEAALRGAATREKNRKAAERAAKERVKRPAAKKGRPAAIVERPAAKKAPVRKPVKARDKPKPIKARAEAKREREKREEEEAAQKAGDEAVAAIRKDRANRERERLRKKENPDFNKWPKVDLTRRKPFTLIESATQKGLKNIRYSEDGVLVAENENGVLYRPYKVIHDTRGTTSVYWTISQTIDAYHSADDFTDMYGLEETDHHASFYEDNGNELLS